MKKFLVLLLSACLVCVNVTALTGFALEQDDLKVQQIEINDDTTRIEIHKNSKASKSEKSVSKLQSLINDNNLDEQLAKQSSDIIIQKQILKKPIIPGPIVDYGDEDIPEVQGSWSDSENYLTIYTYAYRLGNNPNGYPVYKIKGTVFIFKPFKIRKQDEFVLHHTDGANYKTDSASGKQGYHEYIENYNSYMSKPDIKDNYVNNDITPTFPSMYGVDFALKFPEDRSESATGHGVTVYHKESYTNWWCEGSYNIVVTHNTNIQTCYYHNEMLLGGNLSVSVSAFGVSISANVLNSYTAYEAEPLLIEVEK